MWTRPSMVVLIACICWLACNGRGIDGGVSTNDDGNDDNDEDDNGGDGEGDDPYPQCGPDSISLCPFGGASGFGMGDECWEACNCHIPCAQHSDCPVPLSGEALPLCVAGNCRLSCANGEACPDGMECVKNHGGETACYWVTEPEDNYRCQADVDPEFCVRETTKEDCEALQSDTQDTGCIWVTERIYSSGDPSCEAASTETGCVIGKRLYECDDVAQCAPGEPHLYWDELGAGTVLLTEVEDCEWMPQRSNRCEMGDPPIPLLCGCACTGADP